MPIEVKASSIHGQGVFARRMFRRGERIGRYHSRRTLTDGMHVLWLHDGEKWKGYEGIGRLRFLNHDPRPNSEFRGLEVHALRTIRPGEEITVHYGEEWVDVA